MATTVGMGAQKENSELDRLKEENKKLKNENRKLKKELETKVSSCEDDA